MDSIIRENLLRHHTSDGNTFNILKINNLIFSKNSNFVSTFKDHMIFDYIDEFMKRYYAVIESFDRIPKMAKYYKNYLTIFCVPTFRDFDVNYVLHSFAESRAEIYYYKHYGHKEEEENNLNMNIHSNTQMSTSKHGATDHMKTILTRTIRENINENIITEKNSKIDQSLLGNINEDDLNSFEFTEKDLNSKYKIVSNRSREDSIVNILSSLDPFQINTKLLVKEKIIKKTINNGNGSNGGYASTVDKTKTPKDSTNQGNHKNESEKFKENLILSSTSNLKLSSSPFKMSYAKSRNIKASNKEHLNDAHDFTSTYGLTSNLNNGINLANPITGNGNKFLPIANTLNNNNTMNNLCDYYTYCAQRKQSNGNIQNFLNKIKCNTLQELEKLKLIKLDLKDTLLKTKEKVITGEKEKENFTNGIEREYIRIQCKDNGLNTIINTNFNENLNILHDILKNSTAISDKNSRNKSSFTYTTRPIPTNPTMSKNNVLTFNITDKGKTISTNVNFIEPHSNRKKTKTTCDKDTNMENNANSNTNNNFTLSNNIPGTGNVNANANVNAIPTLGNTPGRVSINLKKNTAFPFKNSISKSPSGKNASTCPVKVTEQKCEDTPSLQSILESTKMLSRNTAQSLYSIKTQVIPPNAVAYININTHSNLPLPNYLQKQGSQSKSTKISQDFGTSNKHAKLGVKKQNSIGMTNTNEVKLNVPLKEKSEIESKILSSYMTNMNNICQKIKPSSGSNQISLNNNNCINLYLKSQYATNNVAYKTLSNNVNTNAVTNLRISAKQGGISSIIKHTTEKRPQIKVFNRKSLGHNQTPSCDIFTTTQSVKRDIQVIKK